MSSERVGPRVQLSLTCSGCEMHESEYYRCQSDWGYTHDCIHPAVGRRHIGHSYDTPKWCPERRAAIERMVKETGT